MRVDGFLRTPVRGDHQTRLRSLAVGEVPVAGDPSPGMPFPQTLEISFEVDAPDTEVQIAPLWEGAIRFVPDSTSRNPSVPEQVLPSRYPTWSVVGDLVLQAHRHGSTDHTDAFEKHLPGFTPVVTAARYSKVRLTRELLFDTLAQAPRRPFSLGGATVLHDDPWYHRKRVISFLSGTGWLPCIVDPADPAQDTARLPMPSVELTSPDVGARSVLRVTTASLADEVLSPSWFDHRPAYDDAGDPLVPAPLRNLTAQLSDPAHPGHSVAPAMALFQAASGAAFAPDEPPSSPLRVALGAPRPDGRRYRRIAVLRPPVPEPPATPGSPAASTDGSAPRRPFPSHRLCWRPTGGGAVESLRLPLSGVAYLPLIDGTYTFWVIRRSADPGSVTGGDGIRLSLPPTPPRKASGPPQPTLDVALGSDQGATIGAHIRAFDAAMAWEGYRAVASRQAALQARASRDWNVAAGFNWFIPREARRRPQAAVYGLIRESAGRHGLSPEFLQVALFGEGAANALPASGAFVEGQVLDAFQFVGLDLVVYRTGRLPSGKPTVPPEVPTGATGADERAEYQFNLVTEGYVDPSVAAAVNWTGQVRREEAGFVRTLQVGTVTGWAAAVELVAAELHARLDEMVAHLAAKAPPVVVGDELARRFLAYARFNASSRTAKRLADELDVRLGPWAGAAPATNEVVLYNTIQRLAVTQWHDAAGAYRDVP